MIAGGAGITPMYQLLRGIFRNPEEKTRVTLVWGVNTDEDIFLRNEFAELEKKYPGRFRAVYTVSQPSEGSKERKGYVTKELLEAEGLAANAEGNKDVKVLVCGPPAMEKALKTRGTGVLAQLGYRPDQIHSF
jgi:cytochrome-b5 reductase